MDYSGTSVTISFPNIVSRQTFKGRSNEGPTSLDDTKAAFIEAMTKFANSEEFKALEGKSLHNEYLINVSTLVELSMPS